MKTAEEAIRDCYPILCSQSDLEGVTFNFDQVQALMKYYAEQQGAEQDRWIAVEERLPDNDLYVLTFGKSGIRLGKYHKGSGIWSVSGIYYETPPSVFHWQPLPPLPQSPNKE